MIEYRARANSHRHDCQQDAICVSTKCLLHSIIIATKIRRTKQQHLQRSVEFLFDHREYITWRQVGFDLITMRAQLHRLGQFIPR